MESILDQFPEVCFAFAYGSGVIEQTGYTSQESSKALIDVILVVEDSVSWHQQNMAMNPEDYTPLFPLSVNTIAAIQQQSGGRLWYNVFIPIRSNPSYQMKYGVISKEDLLTDLKHWSWLYSSGRLHKPVHILKRNIDIENAMRMNYHHALQAALLLMPKTFNEVDLFRGIASLSYIGDPRMIAGENPKKVTLPWHDLFVICFRLSTWCPPLRCPCTGSSTPRPSSGWRDRPWSESCVRAEDYTPWYRSLTAYCVYLNRTIRILQPTRGGSFASRCRSPCGGCSPSREEPSTSSTDRRGRP